MQLEGLKQARVCHSVRHNNLLEAVHAGKLFDRYIQIERSLGNTDSVITLEKRRRDALGESTVSDINIMLLKYW